MKYLYGLIIVLLLVPAFALGQEAVLRLRQYDGTAGSFINAQLAVDTAANHGIPAGRVYELDRDGFYLSNRSFIITGANPFRIRTTAGSGMKATISLYPQGTGANPQNPPGNLFDFRGVNAYINDVIICGYTEDFPSYVANLQGQLLTIPSSGPGGSLYIDGCILTNSNGNHIRIDAATHNVIVTNTIIANMGYLGTSNLGAGKAIDLRATSVDTCRFENCTFVNWQDRVIRHYNFTNPLAGTAPIQNLVFNHNTLVNGMSYHGLLSLGNVGDKVTITNNLLMDAFALGSDTDGTRQAEFINSGELDQYGGPAMNWIFTAPNDSTEWVVSNNYYGISAEGQAFFDRYASAGVTGEGEPLTHHINGKLGADSVNAFTKTRIQFQKVPALMITMMDWYHSPSGGNKLKNTPNASLWNNSYDFDRKNIYWLLDSLNCSYSAPNIQSTDGRIIGDTRWQYTSTAIARQTVPTVYGLNQNYPNPFNPSTRIAYTLPKTGHVTLKIYNMLGQEVATLFNGTQEAGTYSQTFDASSFSSGVYFYQINAGSFTATKKMMLVK